MGIKKPEKTITTELGDWETPRSDTKQVPINKVGDYCEGEDGNTTLPIEYKGFTTTAILDNGAGVAIATKAIWKKWGKPALRQTRLELQLAEDMLNDPLES